MSTPTTATSSSSDTPTPTPTPTPTHYLMNHHHPSAGGGGPRRRAGRADYCWDRLLVACQKGDLESVRRLVEEEGVPVNHSNVIRQSALHICAWWARTDCLQYLLEYRGQQGNTAGSDGISDDGSSDGGVGSAGANVHAKNTMTGATPLHCSLQSSPAALVKSARLACIRLLLEHGADPTEGDMSGRTALEYLDDDDIDRADIIAIFEERNSLQQRPAIFTAIAERDLEMFDQSIVLHETDQEGRTPGELLFQGQTPLLKLISDWCHNSVVDVVDEDENENENGAEKESCTHTINDPFYKAAVNKLLERLVVILDESESKSFGAASTSSWLCARTTTTTSTTTSTTSSSDKENAEERTAMDILCCAIVERYKQLQTSLQDDPTGLLQDWCSTVDQIVSISAMLMTKQQQQQQQQQQQDESSTQQQQPQPQPQPQLYTFATQAHWLDIARRNYMELAVKFSESSWKISIHGVTNRQGMTPLHFAARSGHVPMVQYLLLSYASSVVVAVDGDGDGDDDGDDDHSSTSWCNLLTHQVDQRGQTALQAAQVNGHDEIVQLLQKYGAA